MSRREIVDDRILELFFTQARRYCQETGDSVARLSDDPSDLDAMELVLNRFHWFAGAGGTCGVSAVSKLGRSGERLCEGLRKRGSQPGPREIASWMRLLDRLRRELDDGRRSSGRTNR